MNTSPSTQPSFLDEYLAALRGYLRGEGEAALARAYELGRRAVAEKLGILELSELHGRALATQLLGLSDVSQASKMAWQATAFFAECLAPFEITHRGYLEANARLRQLNEVLERQVEERTRQLMAQRKAAEEDQARHLREAQEGLKARDTFLSVASHELRTPLTALLLGIQSLRREAQIGRLVGDVQLPKEMEAVERQGKRLARLFGNLLEVSNLTGGGLTLAVEPLDFAALARDVASSMHGELAQAGCPLVLRADQPVSGSSDRMRLEQILGNLLSNAAKYGQGKPIELAVDVVGDRARFMVSDQGIGIAPQDQARIFDRFERAVSVRHYGGFGLGLWIVRQIVLALGGEIRVESRAGAGSTFTVEVPRNPAATSSGREEGGP